MSNVKNDYAYDTIEDYEKLVGYKVNDAFRIGWSMARLTNSIITKSQQMKGNLNYEKEACKDNTGQS